MGAINSILGELDTGDLGFTLTHEHIWQSSAGINVTYPEFFDRQAIVDAGEPAAVATKTPPRTLLPSGYGRYMPRNEVTDKIAKL